MRIGDIWRSYLITMSTMTISTVSMSRLLNFLPFWKIEHFLSCSSLLNFVLQIQMITMSDFQERGWKQTAWSAVRDRCKRKTRSRRSSTSTWTRCCSPPRSPGLTSVNMVNMGHLVNTENYHTRNFLKGREERLNEIQDWPQLQWQISFTWYPHSMPMSLWC